MNETRFMELLSAYGAELSRWPEDERAQAEGLLEVAPHRIKDIWESERTFDHLLALEKDAPASIALETRVLSASPDRRSVRSTSAAFGKWRMPQWATGGAIAAAMALGFAAGYAEPARTDADYAKMLTLTGAGAGSVFLAAMNDAEN
ncbi:MAG TPA: hypothetical protein VFV70_14205 [Hyphomonadaceae bacterium]|nr:hypothetical protein [Hyphomonadaceae bacterium]